MAARREIRTAHAAVDVKQRLELVIGVLMRKRRLTAVLIALLMAVLAGSARATVVVLLDQRGLVRGAARAFWGTCQERSSYVDERGMILTRYVFTVHEGLKGDCGATEEVSLPGGVVGNRGLVIPGMPTFDVGDELVHQLQIYKHFKEIAALLHEREKQGLHGYVRIAPLPRLDPQLDLGDVTAGDLLSAVQEALDALPSPAAGEVVTPVTVTIAEQITLIEERLTWRRQVRFREILSAATTRVEVIVTLLAVLELIKQDRVQVKQERLFGEIVIERQTPAETAPADLPAIDPAA